MVLKLDFNCRLHNTSFLSNNKKYREGERKKEKNISEKKEEKREEEKKTNIGR